MVLEVLLITAIQSQYETLLPLLHKSHQIHSGAEIPGLNRPIGLIFFQHIFKGHDPAMMHEIMNTLSFLPTGLP